MSIEGICKRVKDASYSLNSLSDELKNKALTRLADLIVESDESIIEANKKDILIAKDKPAHFIDRLTLTKERIKQISDGVRQIAELQDPTGISLDCWTTEKGLIITKVSVPFGVVGIIYEARPNVTIDTVALCIKSGNAVVLRGSKDALNTNIELVSVIKRAFEGIINTDCVGLIEDTTRNGAREFMTCKEYIDVLIPRGSAGLIRTAVETSTIPIIETGTGNCHVYIEKTADIEMAKKVLINAKTSRISVCNSCESLLLDRELGQKIPEILEAIHEKNVEIRGCEFVCGLFKAAKPAVDTDYAEEYLDMIISVKAVSGVKEAVEHINKYGTKHSEAILTADNAVADYFLANVDASAVYHNASTRFTDGFEFGFGAELGISTQKLHARGPLGLRELTSYKYLIKGNGQIR